MGNRATHRCRIIADGGDENELRDDEEQQAGKGTGLRRAYNKKASRCGREA